VGWTAAFGCPVLPVVNFQIATSSFVVGAASSSSDAAATRSSKSSPTTRMSLTYGLVAAAYRTRSTVVTSATTTPARV
jgi:hypothetical protein